MIKVGLLISLLQNHEDQILKAFEATNCSSYHNSY